MAMSGRSLSTLSGARYETAFLKSMDMHHAMAVKMAKECQRRGSHAELKQACSNIVTSQSQEIATMEKWLCDWYRDCKPGHSH